MVAGAEAAHMEAHRGSIALLMGSWQMQSMAERAREAFSSVTFALTAFIPGSFSIGTQPSSCILLMELRRCASTSTRRLQFLDPSCNTHWSPLAVLHLLWRQTMSMFLSHQACAATCIVAPAVGPLSVWQEGR